MLNRWVGRRLALAVVALCCALNWATVVGAEGFGIGIRGTEPSGSSNSTHSVSSASVRTPSLAELLVSALAVQEFVCQGATGMGPQCDAAKADVARIRAAIAASGTDTGPASEQVVRELVWEVIARVWMPDPVIRVGPPPSVNEWKMAVVGFPLWFWGPEATHVSDVNSGHGVTVSIDATRTSTTYDFGDGTTLTCASGSVWSVSVEPGVPSPDCGHTYGVPSLPAGAYTVTATSHWRIEWRAGGYSGVESRDFTSTMSLPVGELQSIVVNR